MTKPPTQPPTEALMLELCNLLRQVLERGADVAISKKVEELLKELERIRIAMERHATSLNALVPRILACEDIGECQGALEKKLATIDTNVGWICQILGQPAFHEES